jgi:mRNA-degrading endonuclease RelE of RelBE toxin-antitoxin system
VYEIEFTAEAVKDLKALRKNEQQEVLTGIETQLRHEPTVPTRNRKPLRDSALAEWELRIGQFRVFYNVYEEIQIVSIEAVGFKVANLLFIRGKEQDL